MLINEEITDRRSFLKNTTKTAIGCVCTASVLAALNSCEYYTALDSASQGVEKTINIPEESKLGGLLQFTDEDKRPWFWKQGYGAKIRFPDVNYGIPLILIRMINYSHIDCYSSLCTHNNCFGDDVIAPKGYYTAPGTEGYRLITCSCHSSQFDPFQNGKAVTGPAEKPLKKFETNYNVDTGILTIKF